MRIAIVHSFYSSTTPSGENEVVIDQIEALRGAGYDVRLFRQDTDELVNGPAYQARAALRTASGRGPAPMLASPSWRPDVVHLHNTFPNWSTRWLDAWRDRLVVTLHNYRPVCAAATLFRDGHECHDCLHVSTARAVRHGCYRGSPLRTIPLAIATRPGGALHEIPRQARRVVSLNRAAQAFWSRRLAKPIDLIPNFVAASDERSATSEAWAYVGRLDDAKGIVNLIERWPSDRRLAIFGTGPREQDLQRLTGPEKNITLRGSVPRQTLLGELPSFFGLLVPSLWAEGLPTVALEAMSAGVPLLMASPVSAASELAAAGVSVTYDPFDRSSLREGIGKIDRDRPAMSARARALHRSAFSREAWLRDMTALYNEMSR